METGILAQAWRKTFQVNSNDLIKTQNGPQLPNRIDLTTEVIQMSPNNSWIWTTQDGSR